MKENLSRREVMIRSATVLASLAVPASLRASSISGFGGTFDSGEARLVEWSRTLQGRTSGHAVSMGKRAITVGELAIGTPYVPNTLEAYIKAGGSPLGNEKLTLSLTQFDCVTLVESCLAVARASEGRHAPSWSRFAREVERMRYRGGVRRGYASRLHYFSEWIADGEKRGLVRDMGKALGGAEDARPLRFMTEHRASYPALANDIVFADIGRMEKRLDAHHRRLIPTDGIEAVQDRIETGDVLAFATSIPGIDVSHAAFAYRDEAGILRVLHAPLSGGAVEITKVTLPEYVRRIRRATGILVARPL